MYASGLNLLIIASCLGPAVWPFHILAIVVGLYWLHVPEEEPSQPIITLKYRCELIVKNLHEFPKNVIDSCETLLKEENEAE
jgi:hypothetical protein